MFFIGFFTSPLPYLLLTGLYLSGYAFCYFNQQDTPPQPTHDASRIIQVASHHQDSSPDLQVYQWPGPGQALAESPLPITAIPGPPVPRTNVLPCFYRHELTIYHPIRPPPVTS